MRFHFSFVVHFIQRLVEKHLISSLLNKLLLQLGTRFPTRQLSAPAENILRILNDRLRDGHTCISLSEFTDRTIATPVALQLALGQLQVRKLIYVKTDRIALTHCAKAEEKIAASLQRIGIRLRALTAESLQNGLAIGLSDEQRKAALSIANSPIAILTGAPGTGKLRPSKRSFNFSLGQIFT